MDLSAFLASSHIETPPPYTEQVLEGHTTLIYGGGGGGVYKDNEVPGDHNTSLLTARDVSVMDRSVNSATGNIMSEEEEDGAQADTIHYRPLSATAGGLEGNGHQHNSNSGQHTSNSGQHASNSGQHASNINGNEHHHASNIHGYHINNSRSTAVMSMTPPVDATVISSSSLRGLSPPTEHQAIFQRSLFHSRSLDTSTDTETYDVRAHNLPALSPRFPPSRLSPIVTSQPPPLPPPQKQDSGARSMPPLHWISENPFPIRPTQLPPLQSDNPFLTQLPPLQSDIPLHAHQKRRTKRRRGHSWHGESIFNERSHTQPLTTNATMTTVIAE